MTDNKTNRLYIAYSHDVGLWCIYNHDDPDRYIPLYGYTDEHNEGQRQAAQDVCDMFAREVVR